MNDQVPMYSDQHPKEEKRIKWNTTRLVLLFLLSTVFLALSWQSDYTAFLVFFAFVPVFFVLKDRRLATHDKPLLYILTFLSVFLVAYFTVCWIRNVSPTTHLVIALLRGLTMLLPFLAAYLFIFYGKNAGFTSSKGTDGAGSADSQRFADTTDKKSAGNNTYRRTYRGHFPENAPILVFMAAWMIMEILHDLNILGMSYGNFGHTLAAYPAMIQWYAVTGYLGGTLWILLVNYTLFLFVSLLLHRQIGPNDRSRKHSSTKSINTVHSNTEHNSREHNSREHNNRAHSSKEHIFNPARVAAFFVVAGLPVLISVIMYHAPSKTTTTNVNVIALHTSMDVYDYKYEVDPEELLNAYITSTKKYLDPSSVNFVFWPENALTGGLFMDSLDNSDAVKKIREELLTGALGQEEAGRTGSVAEESGEEESEMADLAKEKSAKEEPDMAGLSMEELGKAESGKEKSGKEKSAKEELSREVMVVTGAIIDQIAAPPTPGTYQPQILFQEDKDYHFKRYNAALFISENGEPLVKNKKRLVPMSEQVPQQRIFAPLVRLIPNLEDMNFSPAEEGYPYFDFGAANSTSLSNIRSSPVICYGSAFSTFTAGEVNHTGSDFLAIILNEGWMQSDKARRHFNWFAICRSVENRRFLVKSSNEGISALIDSKGNTRNQLSGPINGAVTGKLEINEQLTFYTKHYQFMVYGLLVLATILLLIVWIRGGK